MNFLSFFRFLIIYVYSVRSFVDQIQGERDKYRADLIEANARVSELAREGDDTHHHMQREKQKEIE